MLRLAGLLLLICSPVFAFRNSLSADTLRINGTLFVFKTDSVGTGCEGLVRQLTLARITNGSAKVLLHHTLLDIMCDCNSVQLELGAWEVFDSSIVFYTYWARTGDAPGAPCGVRKQVYAVDASGKITFHSAAIYFHESGLLVDDNGSAHFYDPGDPASVNAFKSYYRASFLEGNKGMLLEKEVHLKLEQEIAARTSGWAGASASPLGYCK
jgi:hypothetical protein